MSVKRTGIEGSSYEPKLEIDLKEILEVDDLPVNFSQGQAIGQMAIDIIRERTEGGKFLKGSSSKGYDDEYEDSFDFKRFGKSEGEKPNLNLSGRMMRQMDIVESGPSKVILGWDDSKEAAKAHGHITGGGNNNSLPKRDFFNLTKSEQKTIRDAFIDTVPQAPNQDSALFNAIGSIFSRQQDTTNGNGGSSLFTRIRDLFNFDG